MNRVYRMLVALICVAVLSGCASSNRRDIPTGELEGGATVTPVTLDGAIGQETDPTTIAGGAPSVRVIYFDFDRSEIRPEYLDVIASHGRYIAANPTARVRLEGHTDERGTREYNVALGERRAQSIERMLKLQGVDTAQLNTISYGEELPADERHTPEAWANNRRVNILYDGEIPN